MSAALQSHFEKVVGIVRTALTDGQSSCYFPSLVAVYGESVKIHCLFRGLPDSEILRAVERFGYRSAKRNGVPEFLFFSAESVSSDASEHIMVSGCSKQFEAILGYLTITRTPAGNLIPGTVSDVGYPMAHDLQRVPAWHAMNGAVAKSNAPWWRL